MERYSLFMQRALELAENGKGKVSPNPMVGCVIVHENKIIGEGWHKSYGGPHAEVNAINEVENKNLLPKSTLFVTLEPCSHFGKTPPCADLLIKHNIKKVVISTTDPNPLVAGRGIQKLRDAGIEAELGVLEEEGLRLNARFFTFMKEKRPYLILKWAQTGDGFIAREDYTSKWITNLLSRKIVHKWRSEEDAIMVGRKTAEIDNPRLDVRLWSGESPIRIVIDRNLSLSPLLNLFDNSRATLCYNNQKDESTGYIKFIKLNFEIAILPQILKDLYIRKIQSVIVEGGAMLLNDFIKMNLWDEIRCFQSKETFAKGIEAPKFRGILLSEERLQDDYLRTYIPQKV